MPKLQTDTPSFDKLVTLARVYPPPGSEQRLGYAYSSARLDNLPIAMASVLYSTPDAEISDQNRALVDSAAITRNLLAQYDLLASLTRELSPSAQNTSPISSEHIRSLHRATMSGLIASAGEYRSAPLTIRGNPLKLPAHAEVSQLVEDLVTYLKSNWAISSAPHLAAFALWRLLWIHPFVDGNGRVGRAVAYLILCLKAGFLLPGTPTLPELLAQNRDQYYGALQSADNTATSGRNDVSALRKLIERLVARQLNNAPILDIFSERRLDQLMTSRIDLAPPALKQAAFHTSKPMWMLWQLGNYYVVYVDTAENLRSAQQRQAKFGSPFPLLFSDDSPRATFQITKESGIAFFKDQTIVADRHSGALFLTSGASAVVSNCVVFDDNALQYRVAGTVYSVRLGSSDLVGEIDQVFDLLLSRHLNILVR